MKFYKFILLAFLLVISVSTYNPLVAEEEKWQHIYESDGINICKRVAEGSKFFEFKAVGNLRGIMSEYVSAILDTGKHLEWVPRCLEARNVEKISDQEYIVYAVYAGVWPTADRDVAARVSLTSGLDTPTVRIDVERVELPGIPPVATDKVHIPYLKSCWVLEQISQNFTHVELHAHVDPGGWIPAWLVNWGYRIIPFQFLQNLESQVAGHSNRTSTLVRSSTIPH